MPAGEKFGAQALDGEKDQDFLQLLEQKVEGTLSQEPERLALRPPFSPHASACCCHALPCPSFQQVRIRPWSSNACFLLPLSGQQRPNLWTD